MHTNKPGPARRPFWEWNIYDLYTPLSGQFDINGVRLSEIAAQYCHLTREPQVDKLDRKWRCNILCWLWSWSKMASESLCVLRWRLVYPELTLAASFSSLAVTSGLCVGYNQMEEWSEHNKYDWYSPAQAWPDNYEGFGREGEEWERDSHQIFLGTYKISYYTWEASLKFFKHYEIAIQSWHGAKGWCDSTEHVADRLP